MVPHVNKMLNTQQVAKRLGKSPATINRAVRLGRLTPDLEGDGDTGARWYLPETIDAYVERQATT